MYVPSFDGCWAKVERAKEHRDALQHLITATFSVEENRPRLGVKVDSDTGEHVFYVESAPDFTEILRRTGLILGDAVHNLRAALDHLTFQLALRNTGGSIRDERAVQFPITDSPVKWKVEVGRRLAEVSLADQATIERFQPYHALGRNENAGFGLHPFAMLQSLSNNDKHRLLITVLAVDARVRGIICLTRALGGHPADTLPAIIERVNLRTPDHMPLKLGAEVGRVPRGVTVGGMKMEGHFTPAVSLQQGPEVMHFLDRVAALVVKVLKEFDPIL